MPSKSKKQKRFMAAAANNPDFAKRAGIPQSVAREYHEADKGMYEGGLAPMDDIMQRGMAGGLERLAPGFQEGGEAKLREFLDWDLSEAKGPYGRLLAEAQRKARKKYYGERGFDPETTLAETPTVPTTPGYDPYYGRGRNYGRGAGRRGRGPRGGRGRRNGGGRRQPPPRDIPGAVPPGRTDDGGFVPPSVPPDWTPPDRRAGRDTDYSRALRAHRARVRANLGMPTLGMAEGGEVMGSGIPASREIGYQEGGEVKPRSANPYPRDSARWRVWERQQGRDPDAPDTPPPAAQPPAAQVEEEDVSWWDRLRGYGSKEEADEIDRRVEEMQYRGGYIPASRERGYQRGGYARPPMGGVPPTLRRAGMRPPRGGLPPGVDPRAVAADPAGYARFAADPRAFINQPGGGLSQVTGGPRPPMKPGPMQRIMVPPSAPPGGMDIRRPPSGMPMGGARVPPNLRGYLQNMRMMNRPRRAIPGPAGAGGAPNRVGQSDQQGGLARALQRGTGRPPMSRRQGFYR